MVFPPGFFCAGALSESSCSCLQKRTPIRAPIREPRHTTWPCLHVCTRGGRAPPRNFRYTGYELSLSLPPSLRSFLSRRSSCSCNGTCAFSHTRAPAYTHVNVRERCTRAHRTDRIVPWIVPTGFVLAHLGVKGTRDFFARGKSMVCTTGLLFVRVLHARRNDGKIRARLGENEG